jgi:hypothetical protein
VTCVPWFRLAVASWWMSASAHQHNKRPFPQSALLSLVKQRFDATIMLGRQTRAHSGKTENICHAESAHAWLGPSFLRHPRPHTELFTTRVTGTPAKVKPCRAEDRQLRPLQNDRGLHYRLLTTCAVPSTLHPSTLPRAPKLKLQLAHSAVPSRTYLLHQQTIPEKTRFNPQLPPATSTLPPPPPPQPISIALALALALCCRPRASRLRPSERRTPGLVVHRVRLLSCCCCLTFPGAPRAAPKKHHSRQL